MELKRTGKDWLAAARSYDGAKVWLVVSPAKNLWHCFGCQIGGGPIDRVMKHRGLGFRHSVALLEADPSLAAGAAPAKRTTLRALTASVALDADDQALPRRRSTTTSSGSKKRPRHCPTSLLAA